MPATEKTTDAARAILVVDDSSAYRLAIRKELEKEGFLVEEAANGFEALIRLGSLPTPDLITLDVEMPRLDGFEVCGRLSDEHYGRLFENRRPPVVFITSKDTMESRKRGFELGAADFVTKPFQEGEIARVVKKVLARKRAGRGLTALVVDDSAAARRVVADSLEREGIEVLEAKDGLRAFQILQASGAEVDLVITDLLMPEMDGAQLIRKIRGELEMEDVPIICLTAVEDRSELLNLFKAGASDYLVKPFPKEELLARINVHLERTQLTKRLTAMVEELKGLNRMKDNLLAVCSHDLRSPLTSIMGFTDILLSRGYLREDDREGLEAVKASGASLLGFIDDILNLGKARSSQAELKMEPVDLAEVIESSIRSLRHGAKEKKQDLQFADLAAGSKVVTGDSVGLNRVLNNLISNAVKYTPERGSIRVLLQNESEDEIAVDVIDNGIGIPEEKLPNIFDPFAQFHQLGASGEFGVGLGMAIVKEIVDKHGAKIRIDSAAGKGTRCRIVFQKARRTQADMDFETPRGESMPDDAADGEAAEKTAATILLAEDDELARQLACRVLFEAGIAFDVVGDGKQAVEAWSQNPDKYDLILLDCRMPVMDGLEAARRLRNMGCDSVPILALTAHNRTTELDECICAGMDRTLPKPLTAEAVFDALGSLAGKKTAAGEEATSGEGAASGEEAASGIGLKQIAENLNFDEEKCAKYLGLFLKSADASLSRLSEALEKNDGELAADAVHSIKGGALSMKLEEIRALAEKLEYRAKDGFLDEVREQIGALEKEIARVRKIAG